MTDDEKNIVNMIKRQTNYSDDVVYRKLQLHNNDVETIITEYITSDKSGKSGKSNIQEECEITTNQKIFKAIRDNFDVKKKCP